MVAVPADPRVVNPAGGPADAEKQVLAALGALSAATGLVFAYDGTTDEPAAPTGRSSSRSATATAGLPC